MDSFLAFVGGVLTICGLVLVFVGGYNAGVRDTERRWSDAMNRKEDNERQG